MRNLALYYCLRVAAALILVLPFRLVYVLATVAGSVAALVAVGPRRALRHNLAIVLDRSPQDPLVGRTARAVFQNNARNWIDTLRIGRLPVDKIAAMVDVEGLEHLEAASAENKGVILVSLHLGNFDLVGQALVALGYRVTIPVERMEPKALFDFLLARRTSQGIAAVPLEEAPRRMIRALRAGEVVAIAGDRNLGGKPARVRFFGRDADLPRSPASLALHTGAPLVLGVGIRAGYNHYRGLLTRIEMTPRAGGPRQEQEIAQSLAWALEPIVRSFPDQWLAFSPVWPDGAPGKDAATMNQQRKVAT